MKRFIFKSLAFIIPFLTIILFLFTVVRENHQFRASTGYYCKEFKSAFKDNSYFDVVAIGNSKLLSAIDKKTLEENNKHSVVNLGY